MKKQKKHEIREGDCLSLMRDMEENTFTSIVTDPPYGLSLLGNSWDYQVPSVEVFEEMLRVTKPGGFLLCFGGSRTFHRVAVNLEDAGWHIRDTIMWVHGLGFPKSYNIAIGIDKSKGLMGHRGTMFKMMRGQEDYVKPTSPPPYEPNCEESASFFGYGTSLKPAFEPVIVAMKPTEGGFAANALKHGIAGLNIESAKIQSDKPYAVSKLMGGCSPFGTYQTGEKDSTRVVMEDKRWPANVIFGHGEDCRKVEGSADWKCAGDCPLIELEKRKEGASRYFYCSKPSKKDKGLFNKHPTVKPLDLMEYLIGMVKMPNDVTYILDPFMGSGSTLVAATRLGVRALGCELNPEYIDIAEKRLDPDYVYEDPEYDEVEGAEDILSFFGGDDV